MDGERQPPKENTTGLLRLFVYGTLKRGCWNHERFCRGVLSVEEAVVRGPVYGELLTFDDPETRLPAIDHLEGFLPGGPSLYRRVLVSASTRGQRVLVWLYVEGASRHHPGRRLADGVWRA